MKNIKVLYSIIIILTVALIASIVMYFNQTATLKNGEEVVVKANKTKITAENLYSDLKEKYAMNILVDKIDHILLDTTYKTTDKEKESIDNQINQLKENYKDEQTFKQVIQTYYGVSTEQEFREILSLEYKRGQAAQDYIKKNNITDKEIEDYYNQNIIGDVKASHILIKSNAKDDDSDEEKANKEAKALEKAKEVIKKLNNGETFTKLAKKYSSDKATANKGGDLGFFNKDDNYSEEFINATAQLAKGEYTKEPVKTEYGYEIILKVDEKDKPSLDSKKDSIKNTIAEEKMANDTTLYYNSLISYRDEKIKFKDSKVKSLYENYKEKLLQNVTSNNSNNNTQ